MEVPGANEGSTSAEDGLPGRLRPFYLGLLAIGLVLVVLAFSVSLGGPVEGGSLLGTVLDVEGITLSNIDVVLTGNGVTLTTRTDRHGQFEFLNLDPGNYAIEAFGSGYPRESYDSVHIRKGRSTTIQMELRFAVRESISAERPD